MRFEKQARGFTLIEMAIVLVIIGIILAGVMKGRDIVRGSQVKQFSQQFAQKWQTIAQTYYDKTGQFLNDSPANGGHTNPLDGWMDGQTMNNSATLKARLEGVGIEVCTMVKSKLLTGLNGPGPGGAGVVEVCEDASAVALLNPWQTLIDGEYAGATQVSIELVNLNITLGGKVLRRNVVVIYNLPTDVAQGLDTAIDGKADGVAGSCIGLDAHYNVTPLANVTEMTANLSVVATAWAPAYDSTNGAPAYQTLGLILDY